MIPDGVRTFSDLVKRLVKDRHAGNYYGMAVKLKVSSGLPYQWRDETIREPKDPMIRRLCDAYGLEFWEVKDLISGRLAAMAKPRLAPVAGRRSSRGARPPLPPSGSPEPAATATPRGSALRQVTRKREGTRRGIMSIPARQLPWAA